MKEVRRHGFAFRVRKIPRTRGSHNRSRVAGWGAYHRGAPALWVISMDGRRLDACVNRANVRKRIEQLARDLLRKEITCAST